MVMAPGGNLPGNKPGSLYHNPPPSFSGGGISLPLTQDLTFSPDGNWMIGHSNDSRPWSVTAMSDITSTNGNVNGNSGNFSGPITGAFAGIGSIRSTGSVWLGNGTTLAGGLWSGTGVPANTLGSNGDYWFRTDTPGTANQRIYVKSAGAWVGIV